MSSSDVDAGVEALWVFLPLPQPLPLPDGYTAEIGREPSHEELDRLGEVAALEVSVRFHQVALDESVVPAQLQAAFELAHSATGQELEPPAEPSSETTTTTCTFAEVAVPLGHADDLEEGVLEDALDRAIAAVQHFQRSIAILEQYPIKLVTLRTLPCMIPLVRGTVTPGEPAQFRDVLPWLVNDRAMLKLAAPEPLSQDKLEALADVFVDTGPFANFTDLRRESWVQLYHEGNARQSALTTAIAGEVLLDAILMHLLWEEGADPHIAAELFGPQGKKHTERVVSLYGPRLGGTWRRGAGAVGRYLHEVVQVRHRIVHAGFDPSRIEAESAAAALTELEHYIADRLTDPSYLNVYPRTAVRFCGIAGLTRRGRLTRQVRKLTEDLAEPDWRDAFKYWAAFAALYSSPDEARPGDGESGFELYLEIADGQRRYIAYDPAALSSAVVPEHQVQPSDAQQEALETLLEEIDDAGELVRIKLFDTPFDLAVLEWEPEYVHFPERSYRLPHHAPLDDLA